MNRLLCAFLCLLVALSCKSRGNRSQLAEAVVPSDSDFFEKSYNVAQQFFASDARDRLKRILTDSSSIPDLMTALTYFQANPVADAPDAGDFVEIFKRICRIGDSTLLGSLSMTIGLQSAPQHSFSGDAELNNCLQQQAAAGKVDATQMDWINFRRTATTVALNTYPNPAPASLTATTTNAQENLFGQSMPLLISRTSFSSLDRTSAATLASRVGDILSKEFSEVSARINSWPAGSQVASDIYSLMLLLAKYQMLDSENTAAGGKAVIPSIWTSAVTASRLLWKVSGQLNGSPNDTNFYSVAMPAELSQKYGIPCAFPDGQNCYFSGDKTLSQYIRNQTANLAAYNPNSLSFNPNSNLRNYMNEWYTFLKANTCANPSEAVCTPDPSKAFTFSLIWASSNDQGYKDSTGKWNKPSNANQLNGAYDSFLLLTQQIRRIVTGGFGGGKAFTADPFMVNNPALGGLLEATFAPALMAIANTDTVATDQYLLSRFFEGYEYIRLLMQESAYSNNVGNRIRTSFNQIQNFTQGNVPLDPRTVNNPIIWEFCNKRIAEGVTLEKEELKMYARLLYSYPYFYRVGVPGVAATAGGADDFSNYQKEVSSYIRSIPEGCNLNADPDNIDLATITVDIPAEVGAYYAVTPDALIKGNERFFLKGDRNSYLSRSTMTPSLP